MTEICECPYPKKINCNQVAICYFFKRSPRQICVIFFFDDDFYVCKSACIFLEMSSGAKKTVVRAHKSVSGQKMKVSSSAPPVSASSRTTVGVKRKPSASLSASKSSAPKKARLSSTTAEEDEINDHEERSTDGDDDGSDLRGFVCDDDDDDIDDVVDEKDVHLSLDQYRKDMDEIKNMFASRLKNRKQ